jgi:hypothetical protein
MKKLKKLQLHKINIAAINNIQILKGGTNESEDTGELSLLPTECIILETYVETTCVLLSTNGDILCTSKTGTSRGSGSI